MEQILFQVNNLSVSYRNFKVSNVSFKLKNGDIFGLVGRSGSGKSTIIKAILGLKKADSGEIKVFLNNKEVPLCDVVGYSPQSNSLFPFLTLKENIDIFANLYNVDETTSKNLMEDLIKKMGLQDSINKRINELSGGMQKRADLIVSLIHSPKIIILDEPFSGLDIALQRFLWGFLRELAVQGRIIIILSHEITDIQKYCTQIGLVYKNSFYGTKEIIETLRETKDNNLEYFLEKLFAKDFLSSEGG